MIKIIIPLLLVSHFSLNAQTSIIQDKSGESSLLFGRNKSVSFSSGDASIGSNLSFHSSVGGKENFYGFNVKVKSNEGVSKLLDGNDFKPKFTLGLFAGKSLKASSVSNYSHIYLNTEINNSYFKTLSDLANNTLKDESFFGWRFKIGYNKLGALGSSSTLFGASAEFGSYNNLDDLKSVDKYQSNQVNTTTPETVILSDKKSGFSGDYQKSTMAKFNIDAIIFPSFIGHQFGVGGYFRGNAGGSFSRQNLGFGFFLGQKGAPDKIVLGLVYEIKDIFNQLGEEEDFQKRTGISLTAGYNF